MPPEMEDMADAAGSCRNCIPSCIGVVLILLKCTAAIDAAAGVMTDMGAPPEMVDGSIAK